MRTFQKALAAFALSVSSVAAESTELSLAHFMSPKHPYHDEVFSWLDTKLTETTDGDLSIRIYPGGELGAGPAEQFNRAVDGVADITFALQGYTAAKFPKSLIMELPGILNDDATGPAGFENAFDLIADEYRRVKVLGLWNISPALLFMRDTPVRQVSDLSEKKIRVASTGASDLVTAWGGTPVFMPVTEMYTAMQTGVVDGTLIDPGAALVFKLTEVANYVTSGMNSTVVTFMLVMNRESYEDLSDSQKAALDAHSGLPLSEKAHAAWAKLSETGASVFASLEGKESIVLEGEALAGFNIIFDQVRSDAIAALEADGIPASEIAARMRGQ